VRRFYALLSLGFRALVLHPLRELFTPFERKGKARFLSNYAPEGLVPATGQDRAQMERFGGCINCGVCDAVCPICGTVAASDWRGPSLFALAYSRATPELVHLRGPISLLDRCGTCRACQDSCPRGVPLLEIFAFTRRKLVEVDAARAPALLPAEPAAEAEAAVAQPGLST
jgi:succinate dehydrogenase/fumarate reductase-like Fe-S protein